MPLGERCTEVRGDLARRGETLSSSALPPLGPGCAVAYRQALAPEHQHSPMSINPTDLDSI